MKTYLQRIVHDSLRALPAMTSDRTSEIVVIEAVSTPDDLIAPQVASARAHVPVSANRSAHTESISMPTHKHESISSTEITRESLAVTVALNTTANTVIAQAGSAPFAKPLIDNIPSTQNNSFAPNKSVAEKEIIEAGRTISSSTSEVLQKPVVSVAQEQIENSVRTTSTTPLLHDVDHLQTQQQVEQSPRAREEQLIAANIPVADKNIDQKNTPIVSAPVVTTRAIAQTPQTSMTHTTAQRREPPAQQLHIGEVRITVQDEPRKNAKPKRKRNTESESRLLIRSL